MQSNFQANQFQQGPNSPAQLSPLSRQFGPATPTGQQPPPQWSQAITGGRMSVPQGNPMLSGQLGVRLVFINKFIFFVNYFF